MFIDILKYTDSIIQANNKMALAIQQLERWRIPANPTNYSISYLYISKSNDKLIRDVDNYLKTQDTLDNFFLEEVFRQHVLGQSQFRDDLVNDLDNVLTDIQQQCHTSSSSADKFLKQVDNNLSALQSSNKTDITKAVYSIYQASNNLKTEQEKVALTLAETQEQTQKLKAELDEIRKEVYMDPLTGLYNRKALNKHLDTWLTEDPEKNIAAIVVNIDHFSQLNEKFGALIGNVLLSKVAKKVTSYVGESGLPVRTGGDEFLILLPDVEQSAAQEIAEKIRQGVEKLRFISSKTGVRLPQMTISLGVDEFKARHNIQTLLSKTRLVLKNFQAENQNQVLVV